MKNYSILINMSYINPQGALVLFLRQAYTFSPHDRSLKFFFFLSGPAQSVRHRCTQDLWGSLVFRSVVAVARDVLLPPGGHTEEDAPLLGLGDPPNSTPSTEAAQETPAGIPPWKILFQDPAERLSAVETS